MDANEVNIAFEILLEEIEMAANGLNEAGAAAFRKGAYDEARQVSEAASRLSEYREKIKDLRKEWSQVFARQARAAPSPRRRRRVRSRLPRGLRTPEDAYRRSILEALTELGGRAAVADALSRVETKMKDRLNQYDYQPLPSNPNEPRWRNAAQWCRKALVREGLMRNDSPSGIWEISDRGREALRLGQV